MNTTKTLAITAVVSLSACLGAVEAKAQGYCAPYVVPVYPAVQFVPVVPVVPLVPVCPVPVYSHTVELGRTCVDKWSTGPYGMVRCTVVTVKYADYLTDGSCARVYSRTFTAG